ncbi:hypothetical protein RND71_028309 [Anisodus tanguticus]|uniref:R13L1/DRL21-like LRR repeat region domain-containing protein n=1 Tax=Anisodus tanguticus TaxID=243964 RepID=A0AAE1RKN6_9SOLA|nr:hypothetical protein RND71_028309 [Anisodus tanguticus]
MMPVGFPKVVSSYSPSLLKRFVSLRVLNLSYSKLEQLPSSIGDLVHLRYLDLSRNNIRSLPRSLWKLQNMQTLDVHNCYSLSCLQKQTSQLGSLRILLLDGCPLTSMPPRIGLLTCLKTLSCFIVGTKKGYQLRELQNLNLYGLISITYLERVKNDTGAKEANLSAKANLHSLSMSWDIDGPHRYESEEVKVLEALEPHPNLKYLEIVAFGGFHFLNWINHSVLEKVISIRIKICKNCLCLPPFEELPSLESLELQYGSEEVEYVEEDDVHSRFPTRRRFPYLKRLRIWFFLKKLEVHGGTCLSSISNLSTLTSLRIGANNDATSLPEEMFKNLTNLEYLSIFDFMNLKELPTSLASLNALKRLQIESCEALHSLTEQGLEGLTFTHTVIC